MMFEIFNDFLFMLKHNSNILMTYIQQLYSVSFYFDNFPGECTTIWVYLLNEKCSFFQELPQLFRQPLYNSAEASFRFFVKSQCIDIFFEQCILVHMLVGWLIDPHGRLIGFNKFVLSFPSLIIWATIDVIIIGIRARICFWSFEACIPTIFIIEEHHQMYDLLKALQGKLLVK